MPKIKKVHLVRNRFALVGKAIVKIELRTLQPDERMSRAREQLLSRSGDQQRRGDEVRIGAVDVVRPARRDERKDTCQRNRQHSGKRCFHQTRSRSSPQE